MATGLEIKNRALRLIGAKRITQSDLDDENNEEAKILNDIYSQNRDELLTEHPWNFAIKRATLTELGGTVSTWTEEGTTNIWQATLTTEPAVVEFDGTEGTEKTSIATLTAVTHWYWESNVLYVYSTSDPDTAYTTINAQIAEYGFDHTYSLPSNTLRVMSMIDEDADYVKEGSRLHTDQDSDDAKIRYIAQITDETDFPLYFVNVFAYRLAKELAFPITQNNTLFNRIVDEHKKALSKAKAIDAQEGYPQFQETFNWEEERT